MKNIRLIALALALWTQSGAQYYGMGRYTVTFADLTQVPVTGQIHKLGTANIQVDCYDNASPSQPVEPDRWTVSATTYDVMIYFTMPQSGRCTLHS